MSNYPDFSDRCYQVKRKLGENPVGGRVTYLAINTQTQLPVVIKQFQFAQSGASWAEYEAHQQEIKVLRSLDHPCIPRYLDSFEITTGFCLVQDYKKAPSLANPRYFTPQEVKEIAIAVLEILIYLQQQHHPVIHRDIKPDNILVDRCQKLKVYLVDFGFARIGGGDVAISSMIKGTLGFMSPEQMFNRQLTEASDLYSLGVTLISLLTRTKSTEICTLIDENYRISFKSLSLKVNSNFVQWLKKMTALNLKYRYPNATIALKELQEIEAVSNATFLSMLLNYLKSRTRLAVVGIVSLGLFLCFGIILIKFTHKPTVNVRTSPPIETYQNVARRLLQTGACPGCDLRNLYLGNTNLVGVNLEGANLEGTNLEGAKLMNANLMNANLKKARLNGANLGGTNLKGAVLGGNNSMAAFLMDVNLVDANLQNAYLVNVNFQGSNLEGANLENANLQGANLMSTHLWSTNLKGATLGGYNQIGGTEAASLGGANLVGVNLEGVDLKGVYLVDAKLTEVNLENANLQNANFRNAQLEAVNLKGAKGVDLENAQLKDVIMPDGSKHNAE